MNVEDDTHEETRRYTKRYKTFTAKLPLSDIERTEEHLKKMTPKPDGKYEHEGVIAYGGMKLISRLRDKDTLRDVAHATLLNPDADMGTIGRFIREARITANLEHPNIIPIHDIGVEGNNIPYFTMKLMDGDTLYDILEHLRSRDPEYVTRFNLSERLRIFRHVLSAIFFAHNKGVIHLDLSPGNILVGKYGEVLVLDWGLSKILSESKNPVMKIEAMRNEMRKRLEASPIADQTDGIAQGTPGYMAPEQASGHHSLHDVRTDIYALGAILYSILTLESAIPGKTIRDVLRNTVEGNFIPPRDRVRFYIPSSLNAVVMKAMATDPANRYQRVSELREDIDAFLDGRATLAERPTLLKHGLLFFRRNAVPVILAFLLIALLGGYGIYQVLNDYMALWHWGKPVYAVNYAADIKSGIPGLQFSDTCNNAATDPFVFGAKGFVIPPRCSAWISEPKPYMDAHVAFTVNAPLLDMDIFWGCSNVPLIDSAYAPPGTMIRIRNKTISVSNNRYSGVPVPFDTKKISIWSRQSMEYVVTVQTINGEMNIFINNIHVFNTNDPYPAPHGKAWLGIRAGNQSLTLGAIRVSPASPDASLGQFAIPEMLVWRDAVAEAVQQYIRIAGQTASADVANQSLQRAMYLILYRMRDFTNPVIELDAVRNVFPEEFPNWLEDQYYAVKAELYWRNGDFSESFRFLRLISDPQCRHLAACQLAGYHYDLSPEIARILNTFVTQTE